MDSLNEALLLLAGAFDLEQLVVIYKDGAALRTRALANNNDPAMCAGSKRMAEICHEALDKHCEEINDIMLAAHQKEGVNG